ncbi:MAG: hypothetical protein IJ297_04805 [Clostridia bacterium]|nr:hypothetical protein [Clostridia bacterium]
MSEVAFSENELLGKVILVGFTYYTADDEFVERKQFCGEVFKVLENTIWLRQKDGSEFSIPNDQEAIEDAPEGEYTLRSTGEVVVNPDYLSTWNITMTD